MKGTGYKVRPSKAVEADKHKLADLVRYLARRAAERDYEAMTDNQSPKQTVKR